MFKAIWEYLVGPDVYGFDADGQPLHLKPPKVPSGINNPPPGPRPEGAPVATTPFQRMRECRLHYESRLPAPPIGLRPRWLHDELRMLEIIEAIHRYRIAGMEIPEEWEIEYEELKDAKRIAKDKKAKDFIKKMASK